jgi:hypothetical protein
LPFHQSAEGVGHEPLPRNDLVQLPQLAHGEGLGDEALGVGLDGTTVAVKIQYPGAGEALVADLDTLKLLMPVMHAAAPRLDARQLFAELRAHLVDEVDYVQEADAQTAFADAYRDAPDVLVPDVVAVEGQVLITRWVDGTPLSRVIAAGSREERDRAGLLLVRLFTSGPARARQLHGDPHPGNFRLLDDGRLAVLDFGATEAMPAGWPSRLKHRRAPVRGAVLVSLQVAVPTTTRVTSGRGSKGRPTGQGCGRRRRSWLTPFADGGSLCERGDDGGIVR